MNVHDRNYANGSNSDNRDQAEILDNYDNVYDNYLDNDIESPLSSHGQFQMPQKYPDPHKFIIKATDISDQEE